MKQIIVLLCLWSGGLLAQSTTKKITWPAGKKMALSLTFDDGRGSQVLAGVKRPCRPGGLWRMRAMKSGIIRLCIPVLGILHGRDRRPWKNTL